MPKVRFRHNENGQIVETDLVICRPEEWAERPESRDQAWATGVINEDGEYDSLFLGPLWLALRLGEQHQTAALRVLSDR